MNNKGAFFKNKWFYILIVFLTLIGFLPMPYYITQPGDARELTPIIDVEGGYNESGDFMLTTVLMGKANVASLLYAKVNEYRHIYKPQSFRYEDETDTEYNTRQLELMHSSQNAATYIAYEMANKEVEIINHGVLITNVIEDMPADGQLQPGDLIIAVDGEEVSTAEQLVTILQQYKLGDHVGLTVKREDEKKTVKLSLAKFPDKYIEENSNVTSGIGISGPVTFQQLETVPKISIDTNEIGGPSAGLMFTLEIYNQLTKEDYTKGYQIAGTGTMDYKGYIGPIGGIKQKVVAADNAGAELFFAPVAKENYKDAKEAAEDIGTDMEIIPVEKIEDAIEYLQKLKPKQQSE